MAVIFIAIIMLMRVLQSLYNKKAAMVLPDGIKPYIAYISVSKLFAAAFALIIIIPTMDFSGVNAQAVAIAACSGTFLAINSVCGIKALLGGTIALNSMFSTAGMVIPILLGTVIFNDSINAIQVVSIAILFLSMFLLLSSTKNILRSFSVKTVGWLIGSLVTNGMVMFCQKLFGELQPDGNVSMFSMLTFLIPAVVLGVVALVMKTPADDGEKVAIMPKKLVIYSIILAFAVFVIQQLVTMLTPVMSSAVLFTLVNGGATVIAAIVGAVVYKEKITLKSGIGIVLGILALIAIKIYE